MTSLYEVRVYSPSQQDVMVKLRQCLSYFIFNLIFIYKHCITHYKLHEVKIIQNVKKKRYLEHVWASYVDKDWSEKIQRSDPLPCHCHYPDHHPPLINSSSPLFLSV